MHHVLSLSRILFRPLRLPWWRWVVIVSHLAFVVLANYVAFGLRFDGVIPEREIEIFIQTVPWLVVIRGLAFVPFRLYRGLWRYTGIYDLRDLSAGVIASTVVFYGLVRGVFGILDYPRSIFIVDSMLLIFLIGGLRLARRVQREHGRSHRRKRVLVYGAGDAGEMVVRDMKKHVDYHPVGFLDDDPGKAGQRIHGVDVLGTRQRLSAIIAEERPDEVLVAMPSADPSAVRAVVRALEPFKLPIKTLPSLRDLLGGNVGMNQVRSLSIEDLLARAPVGLEADRVTRLIRGKRVMVTGAGGSIGSQLCRQIIDAGPETLVLFERYENSLYAVTNDLDQHASQLHSVVGDVTDLRRLNGVVRDVRPDIIFHAAAHKHVPLMELNVCEAVKNNVIGSRRVAEAANQFGVEDCVLISSDKAVDPSSVMGATKRIAELIFQDIARRQTRTRYVAVRFGNVLGSNGSVFPRFIQQIKSGGPVTITHPEMRRYFMLISEAVQLVLHAAAIGGPGSLFVLEMGEQIKLVDMARNLIRLSGFVPEQEIPISFIGLRPGEKLSESLVSEDEIIEPSPVEKVLRVRSRGAVDGGRLIPGVLAKLERQAVRGDTEAVLELIARLVPKFKGAAERWQSRRPLGFGPSAVDRRAAS
jgi:FlaA1/EpsC-like NDP-sugar epimerase